MIMSSVLGLFCLVLLYRIKVLKKSNEELSKDAKRYWELRSWHWTDNQYIVTHTKNISVGDDTFSGARLDELVDDRIYDRKNMSYDPADED